MAEYYLELDFAPTVNTYWRLVPRGRGVAKIVSKKGLDYKSHVLIECHNQLKEWTPLARDLEVRLFAYLPDRRKRDLDNIFKSLFDALEDAQVFEDDVQIIRLIAEKVYNKDKRGKIEILIKEVDDE